MNTIIDNKKFQPIAIFTTMVVSVNAFQGVKIFTIVALLLTLISGIFMAINIYKDKEQRLKNSIIEFSYVLLIYFTIKYMPTYIRTFYSIFIVIVEYGIYVLYVNPKFMNRKLIYSIKSVD